jgi:uncharacterized protein (TIGR02118 family)
MPGDEARLSSVLKLFGLTRGRTASEIQAGIEERERDPGLRGLVISEVLEPMIPGLQADAFVEQWWGDDALRDGHWRPPEGVTGSWWLTTEHVYKRRRDPKQVDGRQIKVIGTAYRRDDFSTRAFFDYWRDVHGPISGAAPGLGAYVVSEVLQRLAGDAQADGFVEQWWPDRATLDRASASPEVAIAWEDVQKYAKPIGTFWITREHVLLPPPADAPGTLER